nr:hypothetical protein [Tanacetum cinerariifolium]
VTYTYISIPFEELSDIGSPRADDHEHLMLLEMLKDPYVEVALQAPPSPDYIPGLEEPEQAPPSPDYVPESDFEAHLENDDDEDPEEDPVDYLADGGDDGDDEDEISIPAPIPMPAWTDSEVVRLFAMSSPSASPLSPWSSLPPQIPFPPLPPILSLHSPAASTSSPPLQLPSASRREDIPEVTLPPRKRLDIALGPRYEVGESSYAAAARPAGGLRADYDFVATVDREIMRDPEREVGYGITDSWDEIVETLQRAPVSIDTKLGRYVREFETRVRQDTDEIYMRLDDEQTEQQLLAGRLNKLFRDRRAHAYTHHLMETEARMSREAWVRATDASDLIHGEVMSLRTTVLGQMSEIRELQVADPRRQTVISELLRIDHRRSTEISELRTALQGQVLEGPNELIVNVLTPTFLSVNHYLSKALKELPVFLNGVKECSPSFTSATTISHEAAYGMTWKTLMKMMTEKYCHQNEIRKLEMELWDLKELALLCERMFSKESDKIEKYVRGIPDMIHGSVVASKPRTMQEAIEIATELMDKKIRTFAKRETANKRKFENTSRNTQNQQQQHSNKRQNTGQVYIAASDEKKQYGGSKPLCAKCNYHHDGP